MKTYFVLGSGLALGVLASQGCRYREIDTLHCANNEGDDYCRGQQFDDGVTRSFCQRGISDCYTADSKYGCVAERPADACYSPCGGRSTIDENGECVTVEDSSTGTSSGATETETTTGETTETTGESSSSTTGPMPCTSNEECTDVAAPYCDALGSGVCVPCDQAPTSEEGDAACATADPGLPVCSDAVCVQCTPDNDAACVNPTPVCDGDNNTCVLCTAHEQCGPAACNLFTGACLPADRVFEVGGPMADYPDLTMAIADLAPDSETTLIVHPGMMSYDQSVMVDGGRVVAFLAAELGPGIEPPRWVRTSGDTPQLTVLDGTVLMDGLQLSGNAASDVPGVHVNGGFAWLDRSRIVDNNGGGIVAQSGAELVVRNCFVGGGGGLDVDAIAVNASSLDMLYTTAGGGAVISTQTRALYCEAAVAVNVRNSILVSLDDDPEIVCPGAGLINSATEAQVGTLDAMWFMGYGTGDFHLQNQGLTVFADIAQWTTDDPTTDIDGDPRDTVNLHYAGADVPQ